MLTPLKIIKDEMHNQVGLYNDNTYGGIYFVNDLSLKLNEIKILCSFSYKNKMNRLTDKIIKKESREKWKDISENIINSLYKHNYKYEITKINYNGFILEEI